MHDLIASIDSVFASTPTATKRGRTGVRGIRDQNRIRPQATLEALVGDAAVTLPRRDAEETCGAISTYGQMPMPEASMYGDSQPVPPIRFSGSLPGQRSASDPFRIMV